MRNSFLNTETVSISHLVFLQGRREKPEEDPTKDPEQGVRPGQQEEET